MELVKKHLKEYKYAPLFQDCGTHMNEGLPYQNERERDQDW